MKTGIKVRKTSGTMANLGGASSGILVKDHDNSCGHVMDGEPAEEELGKRALWLLSISQKHAKSIQHTREYREFLVACERLKNAHRKVSAWKGNCIPMEDESLDLDALDSQSGFSFLQYVAADDILLRVFEFLESQSLVASRMTCSRFCELADRSAARRVHHVAKERQLSSNMMLLRAKEQIEGVAIDAVRCHVRVPTLLLSRRVRVTNAGDPCYNGIFHCTGSNGNGFVFTKPREPAQRVDRRSLRSLSDDVILDLSRDESEVARPGKLLRCIIAKRFSNETILWYLSKEIIATEDNGQEVRAGDVIQLFSFWSKLMVIGDASPDICRYPSQSSILGTHGEGWQTLTTTRTRDPPIVELLD